VNRRAFAFSIVAAALAPQIGVAQTVSLQDALARLFTGPDLQPSWFSAPFLAQIPIEQCRSIVSATVATLGPFVSVAPNGKSYTLTFARGTIQAEGKLDASGAFTGLLFSRMQSAAASERLTAILNGGKPPAAWFSDRFLAQVPIDKVDAVLAAVKTQYGAFVKASPAKDGTYDIAFAKGNGHALIYLGPDGKIEGLILQPN
jgi:hypothetical protein